jgi:phosphate-selective porin OprO/OprP
MRTRSVRRRWWLAAITLTGVLATALTAPAADSSLPDPTPDEVKRRLRELEEQVDRLNHESRQHEVQIDNQIRNPLVQWKDGFFISSTDNRFKLRIGAYTQADGRFFINDEANQNTNQFLLRRVRLDLQGTVFKYFDFRILPDFGGSSVQIYDSYLDFNYFPEATLRFGKFKPPVGLERLQSATSLMFVERGLPTNLVPNRDIGVQCFGDVLDGAVGYQLGIINGVPDNLNPTSVNDTNDDKDFVGRVFALPFTSTGVSALKSLGVGVAGSYGREGGNTSTPDVPTYKSTGQATFFSFNGSVTNATDPTKNLGPVIAFGQRSRVSPQAYYHVGSFGSLFEYVYESQEYKRDKKTATFGNDAWQVAASYVLTGEPASYKGVTPFRPFQPLDDGGWGPGAFELAGRYGEIDIDSGVYSTGFADKTKSAHQATEFVLGGNWYLNKNVKVVLDYAQTEFADGAKRGNRPNEYVIESRVQLAF